MHGINTIEKRLSKVEFFNGFLNPSITHIELLL